MKEMTNKIQHVGQAEHEKNGNSHCDHCGQNDEGENCCGEKLIFHKMKRLNDVMMIPPGGYRWYCRTHGVRFKADYFPELMEKVEGYLKANHLDVPEDFSGFLQHEMCEQNGWGPETCHSLE